MKPLLWHQPAAYHRAIYLHNERTRPFESAKFAVGAFLALIGVRFIAGMRPAPDAHPPGWGSTAAVATVFAIFVAYGLPALMSLLSGSVVILSDKGVNSNKRVGLGWAIRFWAWD